VNTMVKESKVLLFGAVVRFVVLSFVLNYWLY